MKRTIRAIPSADNITVELSYLFAATPAASLSILRHGMRESMFSLHELGQICEAIGEMKFEIEVSNRLHPTHNPKA